MADDLVPASTLEVDDLQLGVLPDGTAFVSGRSLATLCGVGANAIHTWGREWTRDSTKPRDVALRQLLDAAGYASDSLFLKVVFNGVYTAAYPDVVAMAVLEYYAFDASARVDPAVRARAMDNYRKFARAGLRVFIYEACGYSTQAPQIPPQWKHFHERIELNRVPRGYFSVWVEVYPLLTDAIRAGLVLDSHTVPDISIGQGWSKRWKDQGYEEVHGSRTQYPHQYPADSPQSAADIHAWIYPISALGDFRQWLYDDYLPNKFGDYLERKRRQGLLTVQAMNLILDAIVPDQLEDRGP